MTLPKYRPKGRCPKCGYDTVTTVFQSSAHQDCPEFGVGYEQVRAGQQIISWSRTEPSRTEIEARISATVATWVEHLDRTCVRCGFGWAEAVR